MSVMHRVNDNDNKFAKYYTCSLLNTLQSKIVGLVEKKCQPNLRNYYLIDSVNFSISFELLRV